MFKFMINLSILDNKCNIYLYNLYIYINYSINDM